MAAVLAKSQTILSPFYDKKGTGNITGIFLFPRKSPVNASRSDAQRGSLMPLLS